MHSLLPAFFAGLVQGIVEWLPVSSKTIIILVFRASGQTNFAVNYVMGLLANFGSFFAALAYFRKDIFSALRGLRAPFADTVDSLKLRYLFFATLATGVIGVPIYLVVRHTFARSSGTVAMVIIGLLLLVTSFVNLRREKLAAAKAPVVSQPGDLPSLAGINEEDDKSQIPRTGTSIIVGLLQGFAALPGISRSAMTVTPLLLKGLSPKEALRFSFLLDVVALLGAGVVPLVIGKGGLSAVNQIGILPVVVMIVVAAIVSFLMIGTVLRFAARLRGSVATFIIGAVTLVAALVVK